MLAAAAVCVLLIGSAVVGYNGWPGHLVGASADEGQLAIAPGGASATRIAAERIRAGGVSAAAAAAPAAARTAPAAPRESARPVIATIQGRGAGGGGAAQPRATAPDTAAQAPAGSTTAPAPAAPAPGLADLLPAANAAPALTRRLGESVKQAGTGLAGTIGGGSLGDVATSTTTVLGDTVIDLGGGLATDAP